MTIPPKLKKGDTVAITATSGPVNPQKLAAGIKILENMSLKVRIMESCHTTHSDDASPYLAAPDEIRLRDLHTAFSDPDIKGIFAARGGYGAARLLPHLNYNLIRQNPKIFAGYSDVTALHIALNQICNLVTYHAPMPAADLPTADLPTLKSLHQSLFVATHPQMPKSFEGGLGETFLQKSFPQGFKKGLLKGGNLSVICASLGTPYEIDTRGCVLFLEEIDEPPYRIDRMIVQLKQAGKLRDAVGFVLGDFSPETTETIKLAIGELLVAEGKPVLVGLPCGHCMPNMTLPLGAVAEIRESLHPLRIYCHPQIPAEHIRF
ncbi:MAG: LD-carboxypeptidase [Defluviitaleaceae bacterium]|nr:LD-carboxypeptidase [Defluviitaleaceae bacterium]